MGCAYRDSDEPPKQFVDLCGYALKIIEIKLLVSENLCFLGRLAV